MNTFPHDAYLRFWGVRGSYPAPFASHLKVGGNTSCVEIYVDGHLLVCDGGTGIIPFGSALMGQKEVRELTILLTHYHWDHISGLPFFVPAFVPGWKVNFFGPGNTPEEIETRISGQMQSPYFPVEVETWLADIHYLAMNEGKINHGPFSISHFNVHHPGTTYGYRIEAAGKTIIYVSDNELSFINQNIQARAEEMDEQELRLIQAMQSEERDNALRYAKDADIFIHDAQYTVADYKQRRSWGHSCYIDTVEFAIDAGVKNLYLFHVDPNYPDLKIEELHRDALRIIDEKKSSLRCHIACEGKIIPLR